MLYLILINDRIQDYLVLILHHYPVLVNEIEKIKSKIFINYPRKQV
jgi:hypothetical protein